MSRVSGTCPLAEAVVPTQTPPFVIQARRATLARDFRFIGASPPARQPASQPARPPEWSCFSGCCCQTLSLSPNGPGENYQPVVVSVVVVLRRKWLTEMMKCLMSVFLFGFSHLFYPSSRDFWEFFSRELGEIRTRKSQSVLGEMGKNNQFWAGIEKSRVKHYEHAQTTVSAAALPQSRTRIHSSVSGRPKRNLGM